MNELQVVTQQTPGSVSWNFEELKAQLSEDMKVYESLVYTDENIKDAKTDVASLRKLQKEVDERRKDVKKICLAPYDAFEIQANELKAIIEKPIALIDEKVKDYEKRRKEKVLQSIKKYYTEASSRLPDAVRDKVFNILYQDKWLNATTAAKAWKDAIDTGIERVLTDYQTIRTMPNDFVNEGIEKYEQGLQLNEAIQYMNALQKQKQIAEERVAEEQRKKEEAARIEAERKALEEQRTPEVAQNAPEAPISQPATAPEENYTAPEENAPCGENKAEPQFLIRVFSEKALADIEGYCKFYGYKYEVVK